HLSTTINDGVFEVDGTHTPDISVSGTLAGTGAVGTVDVQGNGAVSPGGATTTGVLNAGAVTFEFNSTLNIRVNGDADFDQLNASSTNLNSGGALLSLSFGYTPAPGTSY